MDKKKLKNDFEKILVKLAKKLEKYVLTPENQWTIKGFIDIFENIYSITNDTKVVSKILEIHILPIFLEFAENNGFDLILPVHQNWYPDFSFVSKTDKKIKYAVDLKTTYRIPSNPEFCNGFTLGSHGAYFKKRNESKNIQFPYNEYIGHFCLGIIYTRNPDISKETEIYNSDKLKEIPSVIQDLQFFISEKWKIASERQGSSNTANIGSITKIEDIINGNGTFAKYGESTFDDYWINYGEIIIPGKIDKKGNPKKMTLFKEYLEYKNMEEKK